MGYGAYMTINNTTASPVTTLVNNVTCMFDNGQEGSNLSLFNNATIPVGQRLPAGKGQYIEAKASGSCALDTSYFTVQLTSGASVKFSEHSNNYHGKSVPGMGVNINNSGKQAVITLTLYTLGSAEAAEFED
ncbi:MAG: hypothetical protein JWM27_1464 [Gemmatimonadetes bacterium]|nr:hypothetical protein [Gemmatimonadota bacterium]